MSVKTSLAAAFVSGLSFAPLGAAVQHGGRETNNRYPAVSGTFTDPAGGRGAFSGNIRLAQFDVQIGAVVAVGTLTGVLVDSTGRMLGRLNQLVILPVTGAHATCALLRLDLGAVDLELLGMRVHLDDEALGITGRDGPKRSLGAALCSAAQALAGHPTHETMPATLNSVLSMMGPVTAK